MINRRGICFVWGSSLQVLLRATVLLTAGLTTSDGWSDGSG
jgi:hypothetical protein